MLSGCASLDGGTGPGGGDDGPATGDPSTPTDPAAAGTPLLQVTSKGGFMMMGYDFSQVPELTVYDDGQAINHGPQILIYPPPALPNLQVQDLSDEDVAALVAAAREAGLLADIDYGQPPIADAPTTYVTLTVDGTTYVHAAEAFGVTEVPYEAPPGEAAPAEEPDYGLSEDQRDARSALAGFIAEAHEIVGSAGGGSSYEIPGFAVEARPAAADDEALVGEGEVARELRPWPLDVSLADAQECLVVGGDPARTLEETLASVSSAAQYEQDGTTYDVWFRPLLPHESTCADLG